MPYVLFLLLMTAVVAVPGPADAVTDLVLDGKAQCATLHRATVGTPAAPVRVILRNCRVVKLQAFTVHGGLVIEPPSGGMVLQRGLIDGHGKVATCLDFSDSTRNKIQNLRIQGCHTLVKANCTIGNCGNIAFYNELIGRPGTGQVGFETLCRNADWNSNRMTGVDFGWVLHYRPQQCEIAFPVFSHVDTPFLIEQEDGSWSDDYHDLPCGPGGAVIGNPTIDGVSFPSVNARLCVTP